MNGNLGIREAANRENLRLLILLRWIAAGGQVLTIAVVHRLMEITLPVPLMLSVVGLLVAWNGVAMVRWRSRAPISDVELFLGLLADVAALTAQLYLSGGAANPFVSLFLLQVILGAVLLEIRWAWTLAFAAVVAFIGLGVFHRPLAWPHGRPFDASSLHAQGMLLCFVLTAGLLLIFMTRIAHNQRRRDERLAELRQRAAEEDHVVRMGLLAAGAAHELGSPLATLSVLLNDWRRHALFRRDPEARVELATAARELERCKTIVSGILASSGELRGEGTLRTTVRLFLDDLVAEWRTSRGAAHLAYDNRFSPDVAMVSDVALKQMVANVLDNALEASPASVRLTAERTDGELRIAVEDAGPGFEEHVLNRLGSPYVSTKDRAGAGLGLFLVANVARKLGGTVQASNPPTGGARVDLSLPLSSLGSAS